MSVLVVDVGTQRLKVSIIDEHGRVISQVSEEYDPPYISPKPGWAETDAEEIFNRFIEMASTLNGKNSVEAVTVTTQRDSLVFVDKDGKTLRRAILWFDHRLANYDLKLPLFMNIFYTLVGARKVIRSVYRQAKVNWVRQNEPDVWKKTHKVLQMSGYFISRMTGNFVDSIASQVGHIPFDYKKKDWCSSKDIKSYLFPIPREKLPDLMPPSSSAGNLRKEIANKIGINTVPVILSGSDKACEILGLGTKDENEVALSLSTTSIAATTTRKYFEPLPHLPPYPGIMPGTYNPEVEIFRGFWLVRWFRDEFAHPERKKAFENNTKPEKLFDDFLKKTPPGSLGLITHPYWTPGLDKPQIRGSIIGFSSFHKREHIYRSLVEGLFFALREGKERLETRGRIKFKRAVVGGGASESDEIVKIASSVMNLPVYRSKVEASMIGAAMTTLVGTGKFSDFNEAICNMKKLEGPFDPDPHLVDFYSEIYERVYKKIYRRIKKLTSEIEKIISPT